MLNFSAKALILPVLIVELGPTRRQIGIIPAPAVTRTSSFLVPVFELPEAQEATRLEIVGIKHRLDGLEKSMEAIKPTSAELERVRDRVLFAGRLGAVFWSIGKALIYAASGAASAWYTMTGRPPP